MAGTLGDFDIGPTHMEMFAGEYEAAQNSAGGGGEILRHDSCISLVWTPEEQSVLENSAGGGGEILRHDSGISLVWTPEEQSVLENFLSRYSEDHILVQYAEIAKALPDKTIRDVAFRCRWMSEIEKQRRDDWNSSGKNKEEKVTDVYNSMMTDCEREISYKMIGGASGKLLERNAQVLDRVLGQLSKSKIHENALLLYEARCNILTILNDDNMTEAMKRMPPLPVQLNEELAAAILPLPGSSYMPEMMKQMHCPAEYRPCYNNSQPPRMPNESLGPY